MEIMKFPMSLVISGLLAICLHCIPAFEMIDYDETIIDEENDLDKRIFDSIMGHGLNGFMKRKLNNIADNRGFSGFTDKRLYEDDDQSLRNNMVKESFDSINFGPLRGIVKRHLVNLRNNERLNWYSQIQINLVGGVGPIVSQPVDAIYVRGLNRPAIVQRRARNLLL